MPVVCNNWICMQFKKYVYTAYQNIEILWQTVAHIVINEETIGLGSCNKKSITWTIPKWLALEMGIHLKIRMSKLVIIIIYW